MFLVFNKKAQTLGGKDNFHYLRFIFLLHFYFKTISQAKTSSFTKVWDIQDGLFIFDVLPTTTPNPRLEILKIPIVHYIIIDTSLCSYMILGSA